MENKLNWESFKNKFHPSWHLKMQEVIESKEVWDLFQFLKSEGARGIRITPKSEDVFKCFEVDLDNLNIVVMGMDSYPQEGVASGIAFDCSKTMKLQPSLIKLYEGIYDDCYKDRDPNMMSEYPKLDYLVEQGIMLTNAALNCPIGGSGKYIDKWKPFWRLVFDKIFSYQNGLVFIFMGTHAQYFDQYVSPISQYSFKCEHPVASSYGKREFRHDHVFSLSKDIIKRNKNIDITWMQELPF